jgi:hypothetical protein
MTGSTMQFYAVSISLEKRETLDFSSAGVSFRSGLVEYHYLAPTIGDHG